MGLKKLIDGMFHRKDVNSNQINSGDQTSMVFKKYVEDKINEARMNLIFNDSIQSLFYTAPGPIENAPREYTILFDEEHKDAEALRMQEICKNYEPDAAVFIFDSFVNNCTEEEADKMTEGLKDQKDTLSAITVFLYTPNKTEMRTIVYSKKGMQDYLFADRGWEEIPSPSGRLANPFLH